ncbi:MAG: hypothetical protein IPG60_13370 [Bacteroidetes bacterium]|nr:hypothetical protein [Bacteroidota bacterium]
MKINFTCVLVCLLLLSFQAKSQTDGNTFNIYGFAMMDAGYNLGQNHPDWFDVVRPTKLPAFEDEYGSDGNAFFSVRQTRLGFKSHTKTPVGDLNTIFEFELFGTGVDAGQTTFRLRHAYGELGQFGAGQYWSPFMDIDVFPNSIEYWGPTGMVFFRNVQLRWMPIKGESFLTFALERPGASADQGNYADRIELTGIAPKFEVPDLSAEYRKGGDWGYVELAGIARSIRWEDQIEDSIDLSGDIIGWGLNLSTNLKIGRKAVFRGQVVYGEGIQNYMNDAPEDVGIENHPESATRPVEGVALPILGIVAFIDHTWSDKFSTSLGYSMTQITNSDGQADAAFHAGSYGLVNLLYYPVNNVMAGMELQYGGRENFNDGWEYNALRVQFSFRYKFSQVFAQNN